MKFLPILQELFESDTIFLLIIVIAIALIIGLRLKDYKKCRIGISISIVIYCICELLSNFHTNFMFEIILLFVGTVAIGCCIGLIVCPLIKLLRKREKV